jgi:hypothetical protein
MAMGSITITHCRSLAASVEKAGGTVPTVLQNLVGGFDDLAGQMEQPSDPARAILDAYAAGKPDRAAELIAAAAQIQHDADYRVGLRQRAEVLFRERFFKELCQGAADEILDSLRPQFDAAAEALAAATAVVDINVDPRQLAETGTPEQLDAWRAIRPAVAQLDTISVIARGFGPRSVDFGVLDQPPLVDPLDLVDDAVMCTGSDVVQAGRAFRARRADIRTAPWLRITPKLNTISEAKERLRQWAEQEWTLLNPHDPSRGALGEDGHGHVIAEVRRNPYANASADK